MTDCNLLISYNKQVLKPFNYSKDKTYEYFAKLASYPKLPQTSNYEFFRNLMRTDFDIKTKIYTTVFNSESTLVFSNLCFDMVITKEQFLENMNIYASVALSGGLTNTNTSMQKMDEKDINNYPIFTTLNKKAEIYKVIQPNKPVSIFLIFESSKAHILSINPTQNEGYDYTKLPFNEMVNKNQEKINPEVFLQFVEPNSTFSVEYKDLEEGKPLF